MLEKCHQNCQAALAATGMNGYTYKYSMVEETEVYRENPDIQSQWFFSYL